MFYMGEEGYLKLMKHIVSLGYQRQDRTGVGTTALFSPALCFNLKAGFPLLTTKKVHFHSILVELLWFLSGSTNVAPLQAQGVKIWDEWAAPDGDLGPVYGHQWRNFGGPVRRIQQPTPNMDQQYERSFLGIANGSGKHDTHLGKVWQGMIERCYNTNNIGYRNYGARGVHVCDRWLHFWTFYNDVQALPGWDLKKTFGTKYVLDKDGRGDGFKYSPETCQWISQRENALLKSKTTYVVRRESDGVTFTFRNPSEFCRSQGVRVAYLTDLWTHPEPGKTRRGFTLVSCSEDRGVDQLLNLVKGLKSNPHGRRHIVTAWNPSDVHYQALPPCHNFFQCFVADGGLILQLYQRSADMFLGVPFNIASYALLTHMLAQVCGLEALGLNITFGDAHVYSNHRDQVQTQLDREPRSLPKLVIDPSIDNIDHFSYHHFKIEGYDPHPAIKAPVAV